MRREGGEGEEGGTGEGESAEEGDGDGGGTRRGDGVLAAHERDKTAAKKISLLG